jgi:hypothetical protein
LVLSSIPQEFEALHLGLATQSFGVTLPLMLLLDQEYIQPVVSSNKGKDYSVFQFSNVI